MIGGVATGALEHGRDGDWFAATPEAGKTCRIDPQGRETGAPPGGAKTLRNDRCRRSGLVAVYCFARIDGGKANRVARWRPVRSSGMLPRRGAPTR